MKDAILVDINRKENLFNMRKNINKIVGLTLCIGMLTGCAQTPESSLVKPKGSKVENAYTETEGVDMVNEDSSENTKDKNTAVRTTIRDLLNAPETYKSQTTDDSAKLVVNTDATVEIPDVEKISAISVTPAEVTQDLLDLLQAPRRQKMVLRKMTSPVLHRCRIDRNIFTRHLPTDPIPYLSKSEKRQNLAGKSCLRTRPGLSILLSVKEKNLLRSPLGFH